MRRYAEKRVTSPPDAHAPQALSAAKAPRVAEAPIRVLIVDDEAALRKSLARILASRGFEVTTAEDGEAALALIEKDPPEVALVDILMPRMTGLELLPRVKARWPHVEVLIMTAFGDVDTAVAAVKAGAYDFLTKPFASNEAVALCVAKAAEHKRLLARTSDLEERLLSQERFGEIIGTSPKMQEVYRLIEGVASATSTVLILGDSGTGKELVARAIHNRSGRADKPFVAVNCAAIPKELVESELFGHVRGAFTGAQTARAGLFESAHGGTLFLDEIGDLPLSSQVKLLRALQEGEIKRVGADESRVVDVRVLAATNVDLKARAETGEFRKDLYYRLNVIAIPLPPLCQREDDVFLLTHHFLLKLARRMGRPPKTVSEDALRALRGYAWPGNVRELEHAIEHAFVLSKGDLIRATDLPFIRSAEPDGERPSAPSPVPDGMSYAEAKRLAMARFDEAYIREILRQTAGNLSEAARVAGLDRSNFRRIVRKLQRPDE